MGSACETESILEDGNCFFRAVAQVMCGTQKAHRTLRLAVVKHMQLHSSEYKNLLRSQYTSMEDYLSSSKMKYVGTWATEVEIQSTANYLGVDIFTFHLGKWLKYSCMHEKMCNQGIYLQHSNENHYEVVVCVRQFESHNCYELCHNKKDNDGKRTRTRQSVKAQSEVYETQKTCMCADVSGIIAANEVRMRSADVKNEFIGISSSVASIVKHKMQNVCSWKKSVLKDIHSEGSKLFSDGSLCQKMLKGYGDLHFSHWISGQHTVFNKICEVSVEQRPDVKKSELYESVQEIFFSYESCLLAINGEFCAIMKHNDYYVIVDCNVRNASGLGSDIGTSVVILTLIGKI
ncbi:uncharacterized protein LOC122144030 [Cyprinus carpio]|uniref:ubiquitinyl hydrolase 1 n=1 Tax=Cyprinus carpio TaxID=7962 RepID=A0A9Q9XYY7_CYPCA|nr:uncharacterized protein LOC122144030 [Cyprinus carpio]